MAEACYEPRYAPASFKGVSFEATEAESEHGRRGAEGEFPFGEHTAYADLGRKIRGYKLKARFVRNSHIADANRLIRACESPGPGILIHPTRGAVRAACKSIKVQDRLLEGQGETTADLEFVEANDWFAGAAFGPAGGLFGLALTGITGAVRAFFSATYQPERAPFYAVADVIGLAQEGAREMAAGLAEITGLTAAEAVWRVRAELDDFAESPARARDPLDTWTTIAGGLAAIDQLSTSPRRPEVFRRLANWAAGQPVTASDPAGASKEAYIASLRIMAAAHMARALLEVRQQTLGEGLLHHDRVVTMLLQETAWARAHCHNTLHLALQALVTEVQTALLAKAYALPAVVRYDFGGGVHALAAAWEIYSDARRVRDLERYNPTRWPWAYGATVTAAAPGS